MNCIVCGNELLTGDGKDICFRCKIEATNKTHYSINGWICPRCGVSNSPYQKCCFKCTTQVEGEEFILNEGKKNE